MYFPNAPADLADFEHEALEALRRLLAALRPRQLAPGQTVAERDGDTLYLEMPHPSLQYRVTLMVEPWNELTVYFDPPDVDPPFDIGTGGDLQAALDLTTALLEGRAVLEARGGCERIVVVDRCAREVVYWRGSPMSLVRARLFRAAAWREERLPSFT